MCTCMPKNVIEERLRWVLPVVNEEMKLVDVAKVSTCSKRTLERWVAAYRKHKQAGLVPRSTRPKTNSNETPIGIKNQVLDLRREMNACAIKLKWQLQKKGINLHERTIGKFIQQEGLTRKYRVRRIRYKYIKVQLMPGELVEIDIKYVPKKLNARQYYQFTATDVASRWRYIVVYEHMGNYEALKFLKAVLTKAPFTISAIKTDNGSCFTNRYTGYQKSANPFNPRLHAFDIECRKHGIEHYLIDPGKPYQNGTVERSHGTDESWFYERVTFLSVEELRLKIRLWNMYYNDLEHCGLDGKTPNEMLPLFNIIKPTKVCT